jgi:FSR family fosmidomycin resistance protein-like MFS transporter
MSILFFVHFVVDSHGTFFSPLIPLLREKFQFSLATAGLLVSIQSMTSALSQPFAAMMIDRWPGLPWLAVGIVGSSVAFTAIGWSPSFSGVALAILVGGLLFGLCHPDMAARAGRLSKAHSSLSVSVFVTGGRMGFAFGPIIAIAIAKYLGMEWLWIYVLVSLTAMVLVVWRLPNPPKPRGKKKGTSSGLWAALRHARFPISLLFGVAVVRALIIGNLGGFLPTLFVDYGMGLWSGGFANTVLFFSGALGVMAGGYWGDRVEKRTIILIGMVIGLSGMVAFLVFPLKFAFFSLAVVGLGNFIPMGVSVALAQELLPEHRGFASSLTLGGGWIISSFSSVPIAAVAERIGLLTAFWVLPVFLALGVAIAFMMPREKEISGIVQSAQS